ncbi:MAG TPA: S9 family peptidase [Burkholderiaceae bacterium]|nr:S9 family peptidase [Burkholderiaceae bacterium]
MPSARGQAFVASSNLAPPQADAVDHLVTSPFGARTDEYYWLRDDTRRSPRVLAYLAQENAYAQAMLAPQASREHALFEELTARLSPEDSSVPVLHHGFWYYTRYVAASEYPIYARRRECLSQPEQILLDVNELASGHEYFDVGDHTVSPDGNLLAYTQDAVGRRQYALRVKDLRDGRILADCVGNVEAQIVWAADSQTVLYVEKDPVTLLSVRLRAHRLGEDPTGDLLVYEEADHSYYLSVGKSRSEKFLLVCSASTEQSEWRFVRADDPVLCCHVVLPRESGHEYEVEHLGEDFIVRTNWQAPNFRIVRAPISTAADKRTWQDVLAHRDEVFVEGFEVSTRYLAVNERVSGLRKIRVRPWHGDGVTDRVIGSDEPSYAMTLVPVPDIDSRLLRYEYTSLTTPRTTYDYDMHTNERHWKKTDAVLGGFDASRYATEYLFVRARDGTPVPVSLAYRKGTRLDSSAPLYQYGYGSYGLCVNPRFRSSWISLMDRGFVVAIAHVRGGQEMGRKWYDDGRLLKKANTFTDFIDVTDELVRTGYGARDKVCAQGGSAGGLLMGAIANMAPERYRVIVAHVPFVDVVTTMLDESIPLTTNEFDQWGDPRQKAYYDYMLSYSPYDNVRAQPYPAMLVFTGLWDSQVQYYEPAKWVARLRARKTDSRPLLFCIDTNAGHGGKSGRFQSYRETAREYAFLLWQLGIDR